MNLQAEARMNPTCKVQYAMLLYPLFCDSLETYVTISGSWLLAVIWCTLSLAPIVCSELWPVHRNTKINKSSRLQVGVPGRLRTGHSSEHTIGARDRGRYIQRDRDPFLWRFNARRLSSSGRFWRSLFYRQWWRRWLATPAWTPSTFEMQCTLLGAASRRVSTILLTPQSQQADLFSFRTPYWWNKFIGATKSNRHLIKQTHLDIHSFGRGDDSLWRTHLTPGPVHSVKGLKELYISITPQYYRT